MSRPKSVNLRPGTVIRSAYYHWTLGSRRRDGRGWWTVGGTQRGSILDNSFDNDVLGVWELVSVPDDQPPAADPWGDNEIVNFLDKLMEAADPGVWDDDKDQAEIVRWWVTHLVTEVKRTGGCLLPECSWQFQEPCTHGYLTEAAPLPPLDVARLADDAITKATS